MLTSTLVFGLLSTASALALPQRISRRDVTYTILVTYYQSMNADNACGAEAVMTGNVTSGTCNTAYTYALSVQPFSDRDCTYTLWKGSSDCGSDATEKSNSFLPAGGPPVCVTTGVYDGGEFVHASGMLNCSVNID